MHVCVDTLVVVVVVVVVIVVVLWYCGVVVLWCCGVVVLWCCGVVLLWCCGGCDCCCCGWCCGVVVLWCCGVVVVVGGRGGGACGAVVVLCVSSVLCLSSISQATFSACSNTGWSRDNSNDPSGSLLKSLLISNVFWFLGADDALDCSSMRSTTKAGRLF